MREFVWIEWNLDQIAAHQLEAHEVEAAFDRMRSLMNRGDGSFLSLAETPSGRLIWIIWSYDRDDDMPHPIGIEPGPIFVITAY